MNTISLKTCVLMLTLMLSSCASASLQGLSSIPLESRKYELMESCQGFSWQYPVCTKKFLGFCIKKEIHSDIISIDFKDKDLCKKLYNMNFILQVRDKPL